MHLMLLPLSIMTGEISLIHNEIPEIQQPYLSLLTIVTHFLIFSSAEIQPDIDMNIRSPVDIEPHTDLQESITSTIKTAPFDTSTPCQIPKVTRKRKLNPKGWKVNVSQANRSKGLQYTSRDGTQRPARQLKHSDCGCKL